MARPLQQTVHAYRCANLLIKGDWPTDVNLRPWHDEADTLTRLIRTHSQKPTIAAPVARGATHSPAVDLTGMWCVHRLSVGVRSAPRPWRVVQLVLPLRTRRRVPAARRPAQRPGQRGQDHRSDGATAPASPPHRKAKAS